MSDTRPVWLFTKIERSRMSSLTVWLCRGLLVGLLALPIVLVNADEKSSQPRSRSQVPETNTATRNDPPAIPVSLENKIAQLIGLLDSKQFEQREQASNDLAVLGEPAIGPLAYHSLECSPETRWRIKKTLEQICTSGSEPVFLKSVAILKLQFDLGSSNNPELALALAKLEAKWRNRRKTDAIAKLRKSGATINDPLEDANSEWEQMPLWNGNNLVIVGGELLADGTVQPTTPPRSRVKTLARKPTDRELKKTIRAILISDLDENRARVFGNNNSTDPEPPDNQALAANRNRAAQLALQNQIRMNQMLIGRQPGFEATGISVEFGDRWSGKTEDLQLLDNVDNIQELTFVNQSISNESFVNLAGISTLTKLVFDNCMFDARGLRDANWQILNEVEVKNQKITNSLMESCAAMPLLRTMTFTACKLNGSLLNRLSQSKHLQMLQFNEIEIEAAVFDAIAEMKQINYVNLSACKFQTDNYQMLTQTRPNLQIAFTAQAFFGVRGPVENIGLDRGIRFDERGQPIPINVRQKGVSITDVIAGSGAQLAGMKVGDVIEEINGHSVEKFEDLRLQIAQHRVGDTLDVIVRRDEKPITLKVTLGSQKNAPRF